MIRILTVTAFLLMFSACGFAQNKKQKADYPITDVKFNKVKLDDQFWFPRIRQNQEVTIPIALKQCWGTGRIDNFKKAAGLMPGYFNTEYPFDDSDVYKVLEGLSYSLQNIPNKALEAQLDTIIFYIAAAQQDDGYLYTARTAAEPGKMHPWIHEERWRNAPKSSHELYNMGHLYEAAVAHYISTGKRTLLDVAVKNADLLVKDFLKGGLTYEPGHPVIEAGLVKLYRVTGNEDYLRLSKYFIDLRGDKGKGRSEYTLTHLPVVQQKEAVGHAVRAAYLYSGVADVAALTGNQDYLNTINTIWDNVVGKKYYITGGIGAVGTRESFGENYQLPNLTAYCETCAAVANVYWNWRMFLLYGDSKYYDVLERTLYNGVISGISLSGDHFFYPNPLESIGGHSRSEWFGCACCPSNLCRFIASVGGYMYAHRGDSIYVNLYAQGKVNIDLEGETVGISQRTEYPWKGSVSISIDKSRRHNRPFALMMRLPGWARGEAVPGDLYSYINKDNTSKVKVYVNGNETAYTMVKGYMTINRKWKKGDVVTFDLPMDVHLTRANSKVLSCLGKIEVERGPFVYCVEKTDNKQAFDNFIVEENATAEAKWSDDLNGLMKLDIKAKDVTTNNPLDITAIPYYAWCNRGDEGMKLWLPDNANVKYDALGFDGAADTLKFTLDMEPRNDYSPKSTVLLPKDKIIKALGVKSTEFDSMLGDKVVYAAVNPDGSISLESTATSPGHWFNSNSESCSWGKDSKVFSEFHSDGDLRLEIGQFPRACKPGDSFLIRQSLTYVGDEQANMDRTRVVFEVKVNIK